MPTPESRKKDSSGMKNQSLKLIFIAGVITLTFFTLGYFKAMPNSPSNQNNSQGPKVTVEPNVFDFGEVEFGKVVEHAFEVKNIGDEALEIKRVSTSCGCTKAEIDKEKLESGESAELLVTYDSGAMGKMVLGKKIERFIYIKSNDSESPQTEVTIHARVK